MVGRELELATLLHAWQRARSGRGQVILLCGEPGVGKSRVWQALRESLGEQGVTPWQYQCSPDFANSAFYLAIDYFQRTLKFERMPSPADRLEKLHHMLQGYGRPLLDVNLIGQLLSLPTEARYGTLAMTPQRQKFETIRALNDVIEAATRRRPVLMLFEDLHWADPSSLESLDALRERLDHLPLLLVATCRSEFRPQWIGQPGVTALTLGRLSSDQIGAITERVAGGKKLPEEILEQIVAKTDGVPLFAEELTKSLLESGLLKAGNSGYVLSGAQGSVSIPSTLRDSLMSRLDRLGAAKEVAEIGACIGREFPLELLAQVAGVPAGQLEQALERLMAAELVFARSEPPVRYVFKHALIQEAAYDSLLKTKRAHIHARIAAALERHFPDFKDTEPELLAHHLSAAGRADKAIEFWRRAGELARQRFALSEAIAHLTRGLDLSGALPESPERNREELALRTSLGTAWIALRGWAAPEAEHNFTLALQLVKSVDHRPSHLQILYGLWVNELSRGRIGQSLKWVRETQAAASALDDSELEILGHRLAQVSEYLRGNFTEARQQGDRVAALYDPDRGRRIEQLTNSDPLTLRGIWGAACLWMLGFPDQALDLHRATEAHARARNNPFGLGQLLTNGSCVLELRGDLDHALANAEEGERLGQAHGIPLFTKALAPLFRGVARVRAGQTVKGIAELHEALGRWSALGTHFVTPYWRSVLAEGVARTGQIDEGLRLIDECLAQIQRPGWEERAHLAEILRLKGWMLELQGDITQAEANFRAAIDVAREQHAKSWELRAATTYARMLVARRAHKEARDLVAPVYGWFTEGFATPDLRRARALLQEIGSVAL
jgi:predicted ATPase